MENIKQWSGVLVAIAAIVVFGFFQKPAQVTVNIPDNTPPLGALTGPDIPYPYLKWGDVKISQQSSPFISASTTACDFVSPAGTSTLRSAVAVITTGSSTAMDFEWGKSAGYSATTTSLGLAHVLSGAKSTIIASTTPGAFLAGVSLVDPQYVFSPLNHVALKFGGSSPNGSALKGRCNVSFEEYVY